MAQARVIHSHYCVNGVVFGCSENEIVERLGHPDKIAEKYTGEVEMLFDATIFRCFRGRFVECTFPDKGRFSIDGVEVLSVYDWLAGCTDAVDKARFRISLGLPTWFTSMTPCYTLTPYRASASGNGMWMTLGLTW